MDELDKVLSKEIQKYYFVAFTNSNLIPQRCSYEA